MFRIFAILILFTLTTTAPALATDLERFNKACGSATNWPEELCDCVGKNAAKDLSKDGFEFLVLTLEKNQKELDAKRPTMALPDLMASSMYMVTGPKKCAPPNPQ